MTGLGFRTDTGGRMSAGFAPPHLAPSEVLATHLPAKSNFPG
jgi:hypothetical protein